MIPKAKNMRSVSNNKLAEYLATLSTALCEARSEGSADSILFVIDGADIATCGEGVTNELRNEGYDFTARFCACNEKSTLELLVMWPAEVPETENNTIATLVHKLYNIGDYVQQCLENGLANGDLDPDEFAMYSKDTDHVVTTIAQLLETN